MTEYLIILAIIALVAIAVTGLFGKQIKATLTRSNKALAGDTSGVNSETKDKGEKAETTDAMGTFDVAHEGRRSTTRTLYWKTLGDNIKSAVTEHPGIVSAELGVASTGLLWMLSKFAFPQVMWGGARIFLGLLGVFAVGAPFLLKMLSVTDPNISFALFFLGPAMAVFLGVSVRRIPALLRRLARTLSKPEAKHSVPKALQVEIEGLRTKALKDRTAAVEAREQVLEARRRVHEIDAKWIDGENKAIEIEKKVLKAEAEALA